MKLYLIDLISLISSPAVICPGGTRNAIRNALPFKHQNFFFNYRRRNTMQIIKITILFSFAFSQRPGGNNNNSSSSSTLSQTLSTTTTTTLTDNSMPSAIPLPTSITSNSSNIGDGSLQDRSSLCTSSSNKLVADYTSCFSSFPIYAATTQLADNSALKFVLCICKTSWQAGSVEQIISSIPICPAIPGISKGGQAAVAVDCANMNQNQAAVPRKIIQNFGLRTIINNKQYYIPLAGLPPGVLSNSRKAALENIWSIVLLVTAIIICVN